MPKVSTTAIHCHALKMIAGCPLNSGFSISASRVAANATRSVLQKRHLIAAALMVSPQTGQTLFSSFIVAPKARALSRGRTSGFSCGCGDYVDQFARLLVVHGFLDQDVRRRHRTSVIEPIPLIGGRRDSA